MANYNVKQLNFTKDGNTYTIAGETYENKQAVSGGSDVSLVTTGEKYTWNSKAPINSPNFSGTPAAPTAAVGTNTTQIATTALVKATADTKVSIVTGQSEGQFLQTDSNGNAVWGAVPSQAAVVSATEAWLDANVSGGQTIAVDTSLSVSGAAADAKITGELKRGFGAVVTDTFQLCSYIISSANAKITDGSTCIASTKRVKLDFPMVLKVDCTPGYKYGVAFCSAYGNGNVVKNTNYGLVNTERFWKNNSEYISVPSTAAAFFVIYSKEDESTISLSDSGKVTFTMLSKWAYDDFTEMEKFAKAKNLLPLASMSSGTVNGIMYSFSSNSCAVSGTASSTSYTTIYGDKFHIPDGIEHGKLYKVSYSGEKVALHIIQYDSSKASIYSQFCYSDAIIPIYEKTKGFEVRLRVANGTSDVNEVVYPVLTEYLNDSDVSKILHTHEFALKDQNPIVQCARTYNIMTKVLGYTYGERSALFYGSGNLDQIHCGGICALIVAGCDFYNSRYHSGNTVNKSFTAGYGFDFEAYSLKLAKAGDADEIAYLGQSNISKTVEELKALMLFKTAYQLSSACLRWGMLVDVWDGTSIDSGKIHIGDIIFYGRPSSDTSQTLINGNLISHCDVVIGFSEEDGIPMVVDAGSAPITIHKMSQNLPSFFSYGIAGHVPLFDMYT